MRRAEVEEAEAEVESAGDLLLRRFSVAIKFVIISVSSPARVCLSVRGLCDIRRMSFNNGRPAPLARSQCFARGDPKVGDFTQRLPKLLLHRPAYDVPPHVLCKTFIFKRLCEPLPLSASGYRHEFHPTSYKENHVL